MGSILACVEHRDKPAPAPDELLWTRPLRRSLAPLTGIAPPPSPSIGYPPLMARFLDGPGKAALTAAIARVEARSSAEVVIEVQPHAGSHLHADLLAALLAGVAALAFLLFSHVTFGILWILVDPIVVGLVAGWLTSRSPALRRALTPAPLRRRSVDTAARAAFFTRGVHLTSGRTGVLVYIALAERMAAVIADRGVEAVLPPDLWRDAAARVDAAVAAGATATVVADAIAALADALEPYLPRADDDVNELPDEVLE